MSKVSEHDEAAPEVVTDAVAAPAPGAPLSTGLSPAGVLALQGLAGNRAVGQVLARARARPARRAIARAPSVSDEVFRVTQELNKKQPPDAAVVADAVAVVTRAFEEVKRLKAAGAAADKLEDAYREVKRVTSSLVDNRAEDAAIDFARKADAEVQTGVLIALRGRVSGVAGQQHFISKAGRLAGVTIPEGTATQSSADWLQAQTEKAGQTFKKLEEMGVKGLANDPGVLSLSLVSQLLRQYFSHAPADVKPDPMGKVSGLKVDSAKQLEADCDVYASYGARLLRAAGWTTVGYLAFIPDESTGRDAHAVALAKRAAAGGGASDYVSLSNWEFKEFKSASDDDARAPLLDHAQEIYSAPKPGAWKAYYLPAGPNGAFDLKLVYPVKNGVTPYKTK